MPRDPLLEIVAQAFGLAPHLRRGLPLLGRAHKLNLSLSLSLGRRPGSARPSCWRAGDIAARAAAVTASGSPSDSAMSRAWDAP